MKATSTETGRVVSRLGAIGHQEWWHCRTCGDVWPTPRDGNYSGRSHAVTEARLHVATHTQSQHVENPSWQRTPALGPASEKHR